MLRIFGLTFLQVLRLSLAPAIRHGEGSFNHGSILNMALNIIDRQMASKFLVTGY